MPLRVGMGYDIHRRAQGRLLVLGVATTEIQVQLQQR